MIVFFAKLQILSVIKTFKSDENYKVFNRYNYMVVNQTDSDFKSKKRGC